MKCKRPGCPNDAVLNQVYCSRDCAPFAHLDGGKRSVSAPMARSSTQAPGVLSLPASGKGHDMPLDTASSPRTPGSASSKPRGSENRQSETPSARESEGVVAGIPILKERQDLTRVEPSEPRQAEKSRTDRKGSGTTVTLNPIEPKNETAAASEILPAASSSQFINSEEARSLSLNLIDDTAQHLHGLMKSVGTKNEDGLNLRIDPQKINAACNCAKNIHNLLRLKLDVLKEARKGAHT